MDTFPCFLKKGGIIQTWIRLTPCIQPVRRAEKKTEKAAFFPVEQKSAREDRVPVKKKTPAQERGLENFRIYRVEAAWMQRRPKRGSRTPVRIAAAWLRW